MHVLSTPPAFVLSQDQTLHRKRADQCRSADRSVLFKRTRGGGNRFPVIHEILAVVGADYPTCVELTCSPTPRGGLTARTGVQSSLPFSRSRSSAHCHSWCWCHLRSQRVAALRRGVTLQVGPADVNLTSEKSPRARGRCDPDGAGATVRGAVRRAPAPGQRR